MNDPRARQAGFNAASRGQWAGFAEHREKVTTLLQTGGDPERTRLCILGAGNCNDLDLPALLATHREVHLVDLDAEALRDGVARQDLADHPSLHQHGGVDLSGMLDAIAAWSPSSTIEPAEIEALAEWPERRVALGLPAGFDLVASTCLLSQLTADVVKSVGEGHPRLSDLVQAIRAGHLRLLTKLARPGGAALLAADIVSSETVPMLGSLAEDALAPLLTQVARERNFFHGANPAVLLSLTTSDPVLASRIARQEPIPPWRWSLHDRVYLVWAIGYRLR